MPLEISISFAKKQSFFANLRARLSPRPVLQEFAVPYEKEEGSLVTMETAKEHSVEYQNPIITGVIWKQLLAFFFPILLGTFFQQLYNTVDAIIVGQFVGKQALAAVGGVTGTLINLLVNLFVGIASGTTVVVAQKYGAADRDGVRHTVHTSVAMAFVGGALLMAVGFAAARPVLAAMGTPQDVMEYATTYMTVYLTGVIPSFLYNIGAGVLRAVGDTKRPLYFLIVACLCNIVLDILLVVVLHLGVLGVGIATVISQVVSAVLVVLALMRTPHSFRLNWREVRFQRAALLAVLAIGIPAGIQSNMYAISNVLIQAGMNSFGTDVVAAWTAFGKIDGFFWMISGAYGISITTFAGQNFGAGRMDRVKKSVRVCTLLTIGTAILFSIIMCGFSAPLLGIFTADTAVMEIGKVMIMYMSPYYAAFVLVEVLSGAIRGCGDALKPMIITGSGICLLRVVWLFTVLPYYRSFTTILVSYPVSWVLTSILFLIYYRHGSWMKNKNAANVPQEETL